VSDDELRDELPEDLDARGFVGAYQFPDNSRRRIPGVLYLITAAVCLGLWFGTGQGDSVVVNRGFLAAALLLGLVGVFHLTSGWRMHVDEQQALAAASGAVGFPVGHASAQQVWRGLRSRPTWRVFCYSAEEPPVYRALVLVDAVDGTVIEHLTEHNPDTVTETA
jgi:hypothetical protein